MSKNNPQIIKTAIPDLLVIKSKRLNDERGFFCEIWNERHFESNQVHCKFVQDNHSVSLNEGTVRGFHFQAPPHAQAKLVRCGSGLIYDVAVDIRKGSPTYGQWFGIELSFANGYQLFIPEGFLHGFITRQPNTEIVYKCSDYYSPECEGAISFKSPSIGVEWGLDHKNIIVSSKDAEAPNFTNFISPFIWVG